MKMDTSMFIAILFIDKLKKTIKKNTKSRTQAQNLYYSLTLSY